LAYSPNQALVLKKRSTPLPELKKKQNDHPHTLKKKEIHEREKKRSVEFGKSAAGGKKQFDPIQKRKAYKCEKNIRVNIVDKLFVKEPA